MRDTHTHNNNFINFIIEAWEEKRLLFYAND